MDYVILIITLRAPLIFKSMTFTSISVLSKTVFIVDVGTWMKEFLSVPEEKSKLLKISQIMYNHVDSLKFT